MSVWQLKVVLIAVLPVIGGSCAQSPKSLPVPDLIDPQVKGNGPVLRVQSYFFTTPPGDQILEEKQGAHVAGVFSTEEGAELVRGLKKRRGFELIAAPSVTCRSNEKGTVEMIREFTYATEYDPPSFPKQIEGNEGVFPVTPATPSAFETRNLGLVATFQGGKVGEAIDVSFDVSRTSFLGFVNYGSPITTPVKGLFGRPVDVVVTENRIEMPVFDQKRLASKVSLQSGHSLAIGGLSGDLPPSIDSLTPAQRKDLKPGETLFVVIRVDWFE